MGNLIQDEARTAMLRNTETVTATLRYQGLETTGGVFTTPLPLPVTLSKGGAQPVTLGFSKEGPLQVSASLQQDWFFDVDAQVAARGGYGPMIYNSLIVNAYHPEVGHGGYFHPNSGTSEGQGVMILASLLAYESLRDDPATLPQANFYRDLASDMLRAMSEFDGNGPMLRQPIPDNPNTITLLHWLFAAKGPVNLQKVVLDRPITVSGGVAVIPASALGQGIVNVYKLYPANRELLYQSPYSPVIGGGEMYATSQTVNSDGSLTLNVPTDGSFKVVFSYYSSETLPLGSAYGAYPVWSAVPEGYAACAPDTFRWFDMALNKAIELGSPADASKWLKLRDALRMTVVKAQNLTDLREVLRPMPKVPVFDTEGMFCYSDNSLAVAPAPGSGLDPGWKGYNFFRRDPATGYIVAEVPLSSVNPSDTAFSTTQIGRRFDDTWRVANSYQQADHYLLLEMGVEQRQNITSIFVNEQPNFRPFISTTREYDPATRYYAPGNSAEAGGVPSWADQGSVRSLIFARTAFKNSSGAVFPAGGQILNFGVDMSTPATIGYSVRLGNMRLLSGPSAAWVRDNLTVAKKGSKQPYSPGVIPFATNADLISQEFVGYNGNPFHGYQMPDLWLSLAKEAKAIHPGLTPADLPTANPNTGALTYPINVVNENGTPKSPHMLLMEQQLIFLRDSADVWFRDHGFRGPFAHTFVLNTSARFNIGGPAPHTWVYTNDDPNTRWVGYQVRVVESLAQICDQTKGLPEAVAAYKLAETQLVNWLSWLNGAWPNLNGAPFKGMPTEFNASGAPTTLYEEPHAAAIVLRACLFLKRANTTHASLCDALVKRCWEYLELNWRTVGEMKFTWSPDPTNPQWYGFWHGEIIWTLTTMLGDGLSVLPATIDPATVRSRLVQTVEWLNTTGELDARHRVSVDATGYRAALLTPYPNWSDGYQVSRAYRTDIFESTNGEEQRRALRQTPRKTIEFGVLKTREELRDFQTTMAAWQNRDFMAPELTRYTRLVEDAAAGSFYVTLETIPKWLSPGGVVVLTKRRSADVQTVASILGNRVYLRAALTQGWSAGSKFCHGVVGHLESSFEMSRVTNDTMTGSLALSVYPGSEQYPPVPDVPQKDSLPGITKAPELAPAAFAPVGATEIYLHDGEEMFLLRNNWGSGVTDGFLWPVNPVDYESGVVQWDWDVNYSTRSAQLALDLRNRAQVDYFEGFFDRMSGARGNFWMPTWENDLPVLSDILLGGVNLDVEASRAANLLFGDPKYRSVAVVTHDGRVFANTITSVDKLAKGSRLTLRDPWPVAVGKEQVLLVSWLLVWRLTADESILTWPIDTLARTVFTCQTDKAERYDNENIELSRRAIVYTSEKYPVAPQEGFGTLALSTHTELVDAELKVNATTEANPSEEFNVSVAITAGELQIFEPKAIATGEELSTETILLDGELEVLMLVHRTEDRLTSDVTMLTGTLI